MNVTVSNTNLGVAPSYCFTNTTYPAYIGECDPYCGLDIANCVCILKHELMQQRTTFHGVDSVVSKVNLCVFIFFYSQYTNALFLQKKHGRKTSCKFKKNYWCTQNVINVSFLYYMYLSFRWWCVLGSMWPFLWLCSLTSLHCSHSCFLASTDQLDRYNNRQTIFYACSKETLENLAVKRANNFTALRLNPD